MRYLFSTIRVMCSTGFMIDPESKPQLWWEERPFQRSYMWDSFAPLLWKCTSSVWI